MTSLETRKLEDQSNYRLNEISKIKIILMKKHNINNF